MRGRKKAAALAAALLVCLSGCSSLTGSKYVAISDHVYETPPPEGVGEQAEAHTYVGIKTALLSFIGEGRTSASLKISSYEGDAAEAVPRVCGEVLHETALGSYAVSNISHSLIRILSYYELHLEIDYRCTQEELRSVRELGSISALNSALKAAVDARTPYSSFRVSSGLVTADYIYAYLAELTSSEPLKYISPPVAEISCWPSDTATDKIAEIKLSFITDPVDEDKMRLKAEAKLDKLSEGASGTDEEKALFLARVMAESCSAGGKGGVYQALEEGSADIFGFTAAYRLLCERAELETLRVNGTLGGKPHAWCVLRLGEAYRHIDASAFSGEAGAPMTDAEAEALGYAWEKPDVPVCE